MSTKNIKVERLPDGKVSIKKGSWFDVFHEDCRETWAKWYDQMQAE